jgi:hypothetical protein
MDTSTNKNSQKEIFSGKSDLNKSPLGLIDVGKRALAELISQKKLNPRKRSYVIDRSRA